MTQPRPPKRVTIGASSWTVRVTEQIDASADDKLGITNGRRSEIQITSVQSPSSMRDTLLHELLHALCYESGLSPAMGIAEDDEERMIRILTPSLLLLLRRNPQLLAYLTAG